METLREVDVLKLRAAIAQHRLVAHRAVTQDHVDEGGNTSEEERASKEDICMRKKSGRGFSGTQVALGGEHPAAEGGDNEERAPDNALDHEPPTVFCRSPRRRAELTNHRHDHQGARAIPDVQQRPLRAERIIPEGLHALLRFGEL